MPTIEAGGHKVFYVQRRPAPARRPAVVLIHGAGGTHQQWLYQVRDLPSAATYAPDLPGHGRSEGPGRSLVAAYGDWLLGFLDALGLEKAVLAGHSMGGAIALDVALRFPDRVAGLGLVATGARLRVAPDLLDCLRQDPEEAIRLITGWSFGPEAPPEMVRLGRRQMAEGDAGVLYGDFAACNVFDVRDRLGEIRAPASIVCGTADRMTPVKYATYLRDNLAGSDLHLVEGAGHMILVERPRAVVQALASLLESLEGAGTRRPRVP
ncbi:MAG: alpha/beta fold hydrolase [Anaerolineaceae bacterium]|nr:alpha/beta fold hydrolase [Anaerolineaceae bacterium]